MINPFDQIFQELLEIKEKISTLPQAQVIAPPEIINTEELCRRLDISEPTLIKWRQKKKIPFLKLGSSFRYNWPAVIEFLEKTNSKTA